jgi:hypothetical protein
LATRGVAENDAEIKGQPTLARDQKTVSLRRAQRQEPATRSRGHRPAASFIARAPRVANDSSVLNGLPDVCVNLVVSDRPCPLLDAKVAWLHPGRFIVLNSSSNLLVPRTHQGRTLAERRVRCGRARRGARQSEMPQGARRLSEPREQLEPPPLART